ncbi:glutathione peroxidase [Citrus sinensis]|uniref:Glutathione peroxidase n=1 Tax=Citrus sinensis TaxID=2711 RepID=A0ACB8ME51_CITSI|nr:glutathione peroxidase [Citrus sinensis]
MATQEAPKSIYDFTVKDIRGNDVSLSGYRGKFEILAFPCNQFAGQEPGSNEEIQEVACTMFKAEFPIFDKIDVNGKNAAPIYKFLKSEKGGFLGDAIKWNFTKFLVNKEGKVVERYAPTTSPLKIEKDIQNLLGSS